MLLSLLLFTACATVNDEVALTIPTESPVNLAAWEMEGRIGVQAPDDAWQASLNWHHTLNQDRLRISGPFSQGAVSIIVQKDLIYLNEGNGKTALSRNPEAMLRERLGFVVPLASLRYWILGVADPSSSYREMSEEDGVVTGFEQSGWRVFLDQMETVGGWYLPRKLRVVNVNGSAVRLKILADNWDIKS